MSNSAMVISSDEITEGDLRDFVLSLGGSGVPGEEGSFVLNSHGTDLWLAIQDQSFAKEFYDEQTFRIWRDCLGRDVKTIVELQLDHSDLSRCFYIYVVYKIGRVWNVALDDIDDSVVCYSDLAFKARDIIGQFE